MKVLVTGGTGFVGPAIVSALVDDGHAVRVLEREPGRGAGGAARARRPSRAT